MINQREYKKSLTHVLWIGGAPDAGKTTVAKALVEKYSLQFYSLDEHAEEHWRNHVRNDPSSFGCALMSLSLDERWLQFPETQVQNILRITEDDFPLVVNDLLSMSKATPILVEGNLPPALVKPLLTTNQQAIWMTPTESFANASFFRREKHVAHQERSNPQQCRINHIIRDRLFAQYVKQDALKRHLTLLEIDGSHSRGEMTTIVERHFVPFLNYLLETIVS